MISCNEIRPILYFGLKSQDASAERNGMRLKAFDFEVKEEELQFTQAGRQTSTVLMRSNAIKCNLNVNLMQMLQNRTFT